MQAFSAIPISEYIFIMKKIISNSGREMKRIFDKARKLRRELIIWAAVFLCGGILVFVNLWFTMARNGALVPVFEYVAMAIVGIAQIFIAIILFRWAAALSTKKQKPSLR